MFGKFNLSFGILFFFILCLIGCERIKNPLIVSPELFAEPQWAMYGGNVRHTGNVNTPAYDGIIGPTDSTKVKVKWAINIQELTNGLPESHPVVGSDGTVYITTFAGLVAINGEDGSIKWVFNVYGNSSVAIGDDETVYYHGGTGYLYALNPEDASVRWKTLTYEYDFISQYRNILNTTWMNIVVLHHNYVALNGFDSLGTKIVCVNGDDGSISWQRYFENISPVLLSIPGVADNGTIYVNQGKSILLALSPKGAINWSFSINLGGVTEYTAIDQEGNIFFNNFILSSKGQVIVNDFIGIYPTFWFDRYFTTHVRYDDYTLFCFNRLINDILWKKKYIDDPSQSCTVDVQGNVYIFSRAGIVYSYNKFGDFLWDLDLGVGGFHKLREPVLNPDGSLIVLGYWDSKVVAIK